MSDRLSNKRVIFVGAATGIGRATAEAFVAEGAKLVLLDVNPTAGKSTAEALGVPFVQCDISDENSVEQAVAAAVASLGGLDTLVNTAAIQDAGEVEDFDVKIWDRIYAVNARGSFLLAKYAIPHLKKSQGAAIVNTASLAGYRGGPGMVAYASSKGAVIAFTTTLALELAKDKIRVNAVCPGWVDTPFNDPAIGFMGGSDAQNQAISAMVPLGRQAVPAEMAPLYVYLASDESSFMTAQSITIDGGVWN
ncbi:SDR family NAD(P)-dependent oxidoreductase [Sphingomonas abietis]|uniref:SDR family NAD(P)-dependent oxidoreductase n=1 Tax=Sphingomonas abietis TaxID=3012344 RepID=A0ABY7NMD0_9SPHN|nr:SDR family NAD(P)-dependent oxidoreductase [Sphingomonas abietis]WBO21975.1 SDR family NAD(P)-dependent oxidoreductase [Sphingomonas abietis]